MKEKKQIHLHLDRSVLALLGLFCLYVVVQMKFLNDEWFGSDELDIYLLGRGIGQGQLLYKDMFSQHMPMSYFISALFYKMGAVTVTEQRIAFYILFALFWVYIVWNYAKNIDYKVLMVFPLIHCCMIQNYDKGTVILSEHIAGIGAVLLLLEFLAFVQSRTIKTRNCLNISLAILLVFGTIFVGIFPIFFIALGVLGLEMKWKKEKKVPFGAWIPDMIKKYRKLVIICMLPWIVMLLYFVMTHTLRDFLYGAYMINRRIYPKYQDGLGSNIFSTLFLEPIRVFCRFVYDSMNPSLISYTLLLEWIFLGCGIIFVVKKGCESGLWEGGVIAFYLLSLNVRGLFNFHETHSAEVLAFIVSYVLYTYISKGNVSFRNKRGKEQIAIACLVIFIASGYCTDITKFSDIRNKETENNILNELTKEGESIWMLRWSHEDIMRSERSMIASSAMTPWMWEALGKKELDKMKSDQPRVLLFNEDHEAWGYPLKDYAPELIDYVNSNYTAFPAVAGLYILNSYFDEVVVHSAQNYIGDLGSTLENGGVYEQQFAAQGEKASRVALKCFTYQRENDCYLNIALTDLDDNMISQCRVDARNLIDCEWKVFDLDHPAELEEGKEYKVRIIPENVNENNFVSIFRGNKGIDVQKSHAIINGKGKKYDLGIIVMN